VTSLRFCSLNISKLTPELVEELNKFKNIQNLSINSSGIRSVENFPELEQLKTLELIDNFITVNAIKFIIQKYP